MKTKKKKSKIEKSMMMLTVFTVLCVFVSVFFLKSHLSSVNIEVEKLKKKPVQRLVLLQCSVGKIEKAGNNIASAFARSVAGKVLAGDGVVNQNEVLHLMKKCIDYIN